MEGGKVVQYISHCIKLQGLTFKICSLRLSPKVLINKEQVKRRRIIRDGPLEQYLRNTPASGR